MQEPQSHPRPDDGNLPTPNPAPAGNQPAGPLSGPAADEQRIARTGPLLLGLLALQGFTLINVCQMTPLHILVGLALLAVLTVKLRSVGHRFIRYYAGDPRYRAAGPPRLLPRILAPFLVVATLTLLGSGIASVTLGVDAGLLRVHRVSFVPWLLLITVHVVIYAPQLPRLSRGTPNRDSPDRDDSADPPVPA